jgi:hypothetical protein
VVEVKGEETNLSSSHVIHKVQVPQGQH